MKKKLVMTSMVIAICTLLIGGATFAYLTDSESTVDNTFVTGEVDIDCYRDGFDTIDGPMFYTTPEEGATPDDYDGLKPTGVWAPGDTVVRSLVVHNEGNMDSVIYKAEAEALGSYPDGYADLMQVHIYKVYPATWFYDNPNGDFVYLAMNQEELEDVRHYFNEFVSLYTSGCIGWTQGVIETAVNDGSWGPWWGNIRCAEIWNGTLADLLDSPQAFSDPIYIYGGPEGAGIQNGALLAFSAHMDIDAGNEYQNLSDAYFNFNVLATQQKNNFEPLQP